MKILSKQQIIYLHSQLISSFGGIDGIRDHALLDSALQTPFQTFDGQELYITLHEKAARLCFGLIKNHPFIDGNKRIATHAMLIFLASNNISLNYKGQDLTNTILALASKKITEKDLVKWLFVHSC